MLYLIATSQLISGILLGLAQCLVLRPYVSKSYDWILYNAAGWVVGFTLGLFVVQLLAKTPVGMLLGFVFFGVIVAVFQYPVLRREIPHLGTWILANVIGWTLLLRDDFSRFILRKLNIYV